jgi:hypothetical protein
VLVVDCVFLPLWALLVCLWVYNNYYRSSHHTELFHKFSTSILVFKLLNIAATSILLAKCPVEDRMTGEFLELFAKQTRSLYETAFFAYLLLLSKGWLLVINSMERKEFNYLVIVVILVYIFDSAVIIISLGMREVTVILYLIVISHVLSFACKTLQAIHTQAQVLHETGMDILLPVIRVKRAQFFKFLTVAITYFISELAIHYALDDGLGVDFAVYPWFCLSHEIMEIATITAIFYLYRARDLGPFFSFEFDARPGSRMVLPFYEAKETCEGQGTLLAVLLPRNKRMIGKAK